LNGTKFYTWGQSGPGRFMQDFLAGGGKRQGDYTELQVGPAPTQMQNFPVPKLSSQQWTEWFKGELSLFIIFCNGSFLMNFLRSIILQLQVSLARKASCAATATTRPWA